MKENELIPRNRLAGDQGAPGGGKGETALLFALGSGVVHGVGLSPTASGLLGDKAIGGRQLHELLEEVTPLHAVRSQPDNRIINLLTRNGFSAVEEAAAGTPDSPCLAISRPTAADAAQECLSYLNEHLQTMAALLRSAARIFDVPVACRAITGSTPPATAEPRLPWCAGRLARSRSVASGLFFPDSAYDLLDVMPAHRILGVASAEPARLDNEVR